MSYEDSIAAEQKAYENCADVHGLPPIFHYWSNKHLLPKLQSLGFRSPTEIFAKYLEKAVSADRRSQRFVSLGAGNCDLEIGLALSLIPDHRDFTIDCLELNPTMLERGRLAAKDAGVSSQVNFIPCDLNSWNATAEYDAVIANQSLHHVVNLEGLFGEVKRSLRPDGQFLISDMIGRNGHQRWPEALSIVHEFWRKLPPSYRFNQLHGYYEQLYQNWDCSVEGFEGVRSQDILPLLIDQFHFHLFIPYGNVIDPFIDRTFGVHFDPAIEWDRSFIDQVQQRDEEELASGRLKPTHMIAVVANDPCAAPRLYDQFSPESCVRPPGTDPPDLSPESSSPYDWNSWPHDTQTELAIACARLAETGREIKERTEWALRLQKELAEQTSRADLLEAERQKLTHSPMHLASRLLAGLRNRARRRFS